jgi:hypothetical protein
MSWTTLGELVAPIISYVIAYFVHRPSKKPQA